MQVAIGADHRGFQLKELIKQQDSVTNQEINWIDVGALTYDENDDYPDYARLMAEVLKDKNDTQKGILICGSGVGICVAANKFDGIRCGLGLNPNQVVSAREDDNINVLAISSDHTSFDLAVVMIRGFLETEFSKLPKHIQRLQKIQDIETNNAG